MSKFGISDIRSAAERLRGRVVRTPLLESPMLSEHAGCRLFVKAEPLQRTGAFKFRGALNKLLSMDEAARRRGVVTFSAGNHGHAVAAAAHALGCPAVIVLPDNAARIKVESCRRWGADIVVYDPESQDRVEVARSLAEPRGLTLVHPFDDVDVMAGQGTCGLEMCEQLNELGVCPDAVLASCSGGGLSSGIAEAAKHAFPEVDVYVVEPAGYEKMARSLVSGLAQKLSSVPRTLLDGISGPAAGDRPLAVLRRHGAKALSITDDEALDAMAAAFRQLKVVIEPGGAAALAAVLSRKADFTGKNVAVIASGGNVDPDVFMRALARG
jgi:threonine dehydratase